METQDTGTYEDRNDQRKKSNSRAYKSTVKYRIDKIRLKVIRNTLRNPPQRRKRHKKVYNIKKPNNNTNTNKPTALATVLALNKRGFSMKNDMEYT